PTMPPTPLQPAHITPADAATTRTLHHDPAEPPPRRPWQPPLPKTVAWVDLDAAPADDPGLRFALTDRPAEQRYTTATLDLTTTSNLLIVGSRGSGRTTALHTLAVAAREHDLDT